MMTHSFPKGLHSFYIRIYKIVDDSSNNTSIVWDLKKLCKEFLPKYVGLGRNYLHFVLELQYRGFERVNGSGQLEFGYENFVRGQPHRLRKMALQLEHCSMQKHKVFNSFPPQFGLVNRLWSYILSREGSSRDTLWASLSNNSLSSISDLLKHCTFQVTEKGQYKEEFVTAGRVPLSEISLKTMESKLVPNLFFAGEVLHVDGV
ncbi:unnamed protein product, partial [Thlaspi arvense]